jgi:CubicO group peptidase (beta-lactamase class C family)
LLRLIHDEVEEVLKRWVVFTGAAPGASAFVAVFRDGRWRTLAGAAGMYAGHDARPVSIETVYDLASLTKPVVACVCARLVRAQLLKWSTPLGAVLPAARGTASENASLEQLASHRAGLAAHLLLADAPAPPDALGVPGVPASQREAWLERSANARRAECEGTPPASGFAPLYSDLGYILLGGALEALLGSPLDALIGAEIASPLQLEIASARAWSARHTRGGFLARVAPTETLPDSGGPLVGVVHDDNARALAGLGSAGHAGLFGTARAVGHFGMALLDAVSGRSDSWLTATDLQELVRPRPGGSLRLGFDGKAEQGSSAGPRFGARSFGHLGFTGTSFWCDPEAGVVVVLLSNRVCPTRDNILLRSVRPDVHNALFGLAAGL